MEAIEGFYKNRKEAAEKLALKLREYKNSNALVLGIPRGGVEIGYYVAQFLEAELSVIITKKIPHPLHPEYGVGSVSEEGEVFFLQDPGTYRSVYESSIQKIKAEIERRIDLYRDGNPLPDMKNRDVIIADDGIATGVTIIPAIELCIKHQAKKIIVAAPVSGKNLMNEIYRANEVVIPHQPDPFYAVGQAYQDFYQLTDEDVMYFLNNARKNKKALL